VYTQLIFSRGAVNVPWQELLRFLDFHDAIAKVSQLARHSASVGTECAKSNSRIFQTTHTRNTSICTDKQLYTSIHAGKVSNRYV